MPACWRHGATRSTTSLSAGRPASRRRPAASAGRVEPERVPGLGAHRGPVQGGDRTAQRDADVAGVAQLAVRGGDGDPGGVPRADLVGEAGAGVGLVDDDRHTQALGGEIAGQGHVTAEADDRVGLGALQDLLGGLDRAAQPARGRRSVRGWACAERDRWDQRQGVAPLGNEPGLEAAFGAQGRDPHAGVLPAQGVREGERGLDVAGGPPTGEYDMHRNSPLSGRTRRRGTPSHRVPSPGAPIGHRSPRPRFLPKRGCRNESAARAPVRRVRRRSAVRWRTWSATGRNPRRRTAGGGRRRSAAGRAPHRC